MRRLVLLTALLALACGGDDDGSGGSGPTSPTSTTPNIAGTWQFSDNVSASSIGASCNSTGTATITQTGTNFSGTVNATDGICSLSDGTIIDNTGTSTISGGQITGGQVSFQVPSEPANAGETPALRVY